MDKAVLKAQWHVWWHFNMKEEPARNVSALGDTQDQARSKNWQCMALYAPPHVGPGGCRRRALVLHCRF